MKQDREEHLSLPLGTGGFLEARPFTTPQAAKAHLELHSRPRKDFWDKS